MSSEVLRRESLFSVGLLREQLLETINRVWGLSVVSAFFVVVIW